MSKESERGRSSRQQRQTVKATSSLRNLSEAEIMVLY